MINKIIIVGFILINPLMINNSFAIDKSKEVFTISNGYLDGNEYLKLNSNDRQFYVTGLVDGAALSGFAGTKNQWIHECLKDKEIKSNQVKAILDKYISDNPEDWSNQAHTLFFRAMRKACKQD